ncbi:MAG: hypothetical protein KTR33_11755 [Gammaproteobacteria bacterium]|nr:hypothetical protein [Gammaproteobacteria bacterium]
MHKWFSHWRGISLSLIVLWVMAWPSSTFAVITNLAVNSEFEATGTGFPTSLGTGWSTNESNFQLIAQGGRDAPSIGQDGNPTGNTLELRAFSSAAVVTLTVTIPANVALQAATLHFESWSRDNGGVDYSSTGRYRIRVSGSNTSDTGQVTINNQDANWIENTPTFNVQTGDTVVVDWTDVGPANAVRGLRLDDVQLLVDIVAVMAVPEPRMAGVVILGVLMLWLSWRRRSPFASHA